MPSRRRAQTSGVARSRQWREVGLGAQILKDLGISSIRLLTSTKMTYVGLGGFGIEIAATELMQRRRLRGSESQCAKAGRRTTDRAWRRCWLMSCSGAVWRSPRTATRCTRSPGQLSEGPNAIAVDVELVLAVDVSYSMDPDEQALQREGYITGLTSREFMQALRSGANGKVAVTYFEWAGVFDQKIIVPWRLIEGPESADAFVSEIAARALSTRLAHVHFRRAQFRRAAVRGQAAFAAFAGSSTSPAMAPTTAGPPVTLPATMRSPRAYHQRASDHAQTAECLHHGYR